MTCMLPASLFAQAGNRPWTLAECFSYATAHNIQVNFQRLNVLTIEQNLIAANSQKIPSLSATLTNTFNNGNGSSSAANTSNQLSSSGVYTLNSSVVLWNSHYIRNTIDQLQLLHTSSKLTEQQYLNSLYIEIAAVYLDILLARENQRYIDDLAATSAERTKQGQQYLDAGRIARKDLLQLQAQAAGDQYQRVQNENLIQTDILVLKQLLQLPTDSSFDIAAPGPISLPQQLAPLNDAISEALQRFPDLQIGRLGVAVANLDIARAKAGFKPVLSASGAIGTGYTDVITNMSGSKTGYFSQVGNNLYQRAGLTLSIPIFSNRINETNLEKSMIALRQAELTLQNTALLLTQSVEKAYLNTINARQSFAAAEIQLNASRESYRIANEQFRLGDINTYDLYLQRTQYMQAVQAYTAGKYSAIMQQKIYEFYMGRQITL